MAWHNTEYQANPEVAKVLGQSPFGTLLTKAGEAGRQIADSFVKNKMAEIEVRKAMADLIQKQDELSHKRNLLTYQEQRDVEDMIMRAAAGDQSNFKNDVVASQLNGNGYVKMSVDKKDPAQGVILTNNPQIDATINQALGYKVPQSNQEGKDDLSKYMVSVNYKPSESQLSKDMNTPLVNVDGRGYTLTDLVMANAQTGNQNRMIRLLTALSAGEGLADFELGKQTNQSNLTRKHLKDSYGYNSALKAQQFKHDSDLSLQEAKQKVFQTQVQAQAQKDIIDHGRLPGLAENISMATGMPEQQVYKLLLSQGYSPNGELLGQYQASSSSTSGGSRGGSSGSNNQIVKITDKDGKEQHVIVNKDTGIYSPIISQSSVANSATQSKENNPSKYNILGNNIVGNASIDTYNEIERLRALGYNDSAINEMLSKSKSSYTINSDGVLEYSDIGKKKYGYEKMLSIKEAYKDKNLVPYQIDLDLEKAMKDYLLSTSRGQNPSKETMEFLSSEKAQDRIRSLGIPGFDNSGLFDREIKTNEGFFVKFGEGLKSASSQIGKVLATDILGIDPNENRRVRDVIRAREAYEAGNNFDRAMNQDISFGNLAGKGVAYSPVTVGPFVAGGAALPAAATSTVLRGAGVGMLDGVGTGTLVNFWTEKPLTEDMVSNAVFGGVVGGGISAFGNQFLNRPLVKDYEYKKSGQ